MDRDGDRTAIPPVDPLAPPSPLRRVAARVAMSPTGVRAAGWYLENVVSRVEPAIMRWSGGRITSLPIAPVVFLHAKGARTGRKHVTALTYFSDGDDVILIASNNGRPRHPAWYFNIKADPEITLRARSFSAHYVAREAQGKERERLWELALRAMPPLSVYEAMVCTRSIPIIKCTPVADRR